MKLTKDLQPGDTLEINTETLEVQLNGATVRGWLRGEVFDLAGGRNTITYQDSESGRQVEIEIVFDPRYL